jgi:hypothetical protein
VPAAICARHRGTTRLGGHNSSCQGQIDGQGMEAQTATIGGLVDQDRPLSAQAAAC